MLVSSLVHNEKGINNCYYKVDVIDEFLDLRKLITVEMTNLSNSVLGIEI